MFIREWGIWGQAGETAWRWDLSPRPAHRMPERAPATSTGDPQEVWCWQGAPAAGVLSPGLVSPVSPTTCSSHAAGCQAGRSHLSGPLTGARLPGESRGVLISRRGMPAAHRSPLPRLCQYLEPCGSRLAAGAPPLQSTHRHWHSASATSTKTKICQKNAGGADDAGNYQRMGKPGTHHSGVPIDPCHRHYPVGLNCQRLVSAAMRTPSP